MVSRRRVEPTRKPFCANSGRHASPSAIKALLSTPSGSPAAASTLSGSAGSKRNASAAMIEVGTVTMTRAAVSVPRGVSSRSERPRSSMRVTGESNAIGSPSASLSNNPPIDVGAVLVVADIVLDRDPVEFRAIAPGAARIEQLVPAAAGDERARQRAVLGFECGLPPRLVLRLPHRQPLSFGLRRLTAARQPRGPFRRASMHRKAEALRDP